MRSKYYVPLAYELFALRHIGAPGMVSVVAKICPVVKDRETGMIVDMDYEVRGIRNETRRVLIFFILYS